MGRNVVFLLFALSLFAVAAGVYLTGRPVSDLVPDEVAYVGFFIVLGGWMAAHVVSRRRAGQPLVTRSEGRIVWFAIGCILVGGLVFAGVPGLIGLGPGTMIVILVGLLGVLKMVRIFSGFLTG